MQKIKDCLTFPRFFSAPPPSPMFPVTVGIYKPNNMEAYSQHVLSFPWITLLPPYFFGFEYLNYATFFVGVYTTAYLLRGVGRCRNAEYLEFTKKWREAKEKGEIRSSLRSYDYEFSYRPVDHKANVEIDSLPHPPITETDSSFVGPLLSAGRILAGKILARPMMYPGSTAFFNFLISGQLTLGRCYLTDPFRTKGVRYKVQTVDENYIDCVHIDRRGFDSGDFSSLPCTSDGKRLNEKLVICCEGNGSFYEQSAGTTAREAGYSWLGWNHPGYGSSTGLPSVKSEGNAVAAIVDFATTDLGWDIEDIILYSWSIGGVSASQAARAYKDVFGIVLDAPFDHVLPLALLRMPQSLGAFVKDTIHEQMNLDVVTPLKSFSGPFRVVRRRKDNMISTNPMDLSTNRTNYVIARYLSHLYPGVADESYLLKMLSMPLSLSCIDAAAADSKDAHDLFAHQREETYGQEFPIEKQKQLCQMLLLKHVVDVNIEHCDPLASFPLL